jgi:hypothetical protein
VHKHINKSEVNNQKWDIDKGNIITNGPAEDRSVIYRHGNDQGARSAVEAMAEAHGDVQGFPIYRDGGGQIHDMHLRHQRPPRKTK